MSGVCEKYGGGCTGCMDCQDIERANCAACKMEKPVLSLDRHGMCAHCASAAVIRFEGVMMRNFNDAERAMLQDKLESMLLDDLLGAVDSARKKVKRRAG